MSSLLGENYFHGLSILTEVDRQSCMCRTCEMEKHLKKIEGNNRGEDRDETK